METNISNCGVVLASSLETQQPPRKRCGCRCLFDPAAAKNASLIALFCACTVFQVYAGIKVSYYEPHHRHQQESFLLSLYLLAPLMCLTVLWINASAYFFRTLLWEMKREDGLFLPAMLQERRIVAKVTW